MTKYGIWLLAAVMVTAAAMPAQTLPEIRFEKYELPNGLDVILHEDHTIPAVTVNIWYHVGSKNEKRGRTGFAHLFEHMMFEGSQHHPEDFTEWLESVGGDNNASTSEDRTNYFATFPSNHLERILWIESDRMGFLPPAITQEKLDVQRDVVKNERRQRLDNEPYAKAYELTLSALYPPEHPYNWSVIGRMEDLSAASLDDVKDFFETYYVPNNASLVIAGDFDPAQAKQWVEKYFGPLEPGAPIDRMKHWIPDVKGVKRVEAEDRVSLPRYSAMWPTPPAYAPGDAELDLFGNILGGGKTSRLYKALVYDLQIAQDVSAYNDAGELSGTFNVTVTAKEGRTLDEIERAVNSVLADVLKKGITAQELKNAQTVMEAGYIRSLQQARSRADWLNRYNVMLGNPGLFQWDLERYTKATTANVMVAAREWINLENRVVVNIRPQGDYQGSAAMLDRKVAPPASSDPSFTPPRVQEARLSNGLRMLLVEKHDLPLVQVNYVLRSGWADDPAVKPGSSRLTAELLDEGTKTRKALQIAEEAKAMGASLSTSSSFDGSFVVLNVLKRNLDKGLALMTDVLFNPTFPQEELERQRQIYLGRIQQESRQPSAVAQKAFQRLLYGTGHPYSQPATGSGTDESIRAIGREDLVNYYRTHYFADDATLVVVGDVTLQEARDKLEKAFRSWKPVAVTRQPIPRPEAAKSNRIYIVDKPGAPQSVIIAGHLGLERAHPDYVPLRVVNNALGGQFSSRLNLNLREDKGYTYGTSSVFSWRRGPGPFMVSASVQTQYTDESLVEMIREMRDLARGRPVKGTELLKSKDNIIKGYPQDFETYYALASQLNQIALLDLPVDEWQTYTTRVMAVGEDAAAKVAAQHYYPDALLIVVVGDRGQVEPELKKLKLGEVTVVNLSDLQL